MWAVLHSDVERGPGMLSPFDKPGSGDRSPAGAIRRCQSSPAGRFSDAIAALPRFVRAAYDAPLQVTMD